MAPSKFRDDDSDEAVFSMRETVADILGLGNDVQDEGAEVGYGGSTTGKAPNIPRDFDAAVANPEKI